MFMGQVTRTCIIRGAGRFFKDYALLEILPTTKHSKRKLLVVSNNFSTTSPEMRTKIDLHPYCEHIMSCLKKDRSVSSCSGLSEVLTTEAWP